MTDAVGVLYADTSALVKLAVDEAETGALRTELNRWDAVATSVLTEIELARAVARARDRGVTTLDEAPSGRSPLAPSRSSSVRRSAVLSRT